MSSQLDKQSAARRQLVTSLRLFFDGGDLVSVYSLAANAWEIIDCLCRDRRIESLSEQTRTRFPSDKDLRTDFINSPYRNFLKHADKDMDRFLCDITYKEVEPLLILAVEDYIRLYKKSPIECQVFQVWYFSLYPDKLSPAAKEKKLPVYQELFPNISSLERGSQLAQARNLLARCKDNLDIMNNPDTEVSI